MENKGRIPGNTQEELKRSLRKSSQETVEVCQDKGRLNSSNAAEMSVG